MQEQEASAKIIPFPKRHRAINPPMPQPQAPLAGRPISARPGAPSQPAGRAEITDPNTIRALTLEPLIAGLNTARKDQAKLPAKPTAAPAGAEPLSRIIADLDTALTQQNTAVARWRTAIQDLRAAIDGLDGSLKQYRDRISPTNKGANAS